MGLKVEPLRSGRLLFQCETMPLDKVNLNGQNTMEVANRGPANQQRNRSNPSEAILDRAYRDSIKLFQQKLTKAEYKRIWAGSTTGISEVQEALQNAKTSYDERKAKQSGIRTLLSLFSSRLLYYGVVLDTVAQHHPEYVSLAWGTIKFIFIGVLNHEEMISRLAKAYILIADALPRAKLKLELYSTDAMSDAVAQLYAQIMRFSQRAMTWYTDGPLKHFYKSITQPYTLSYKDIIDEIQACSARIEQLAADNSQLEQREIHMKIMNLEKLILSGQNAIVSSGLLNTPFQLRNIEISQILSFVDKTPLPSPVVSLSYHLKLRNRRLRENPRSLEFLNNYKQLKEWASSPTSTIIIIKGAFRERAKARDIAATIITLIKEANRPAIWALTLRFAKDAKNLSKLDILKNLVLQILQMNKSLLDDRSQPLRAIDFQCATTEEEWFELLCLVLTGLPELYLIVDIEVLRGGTENGETWPAAFMELFEKLAKTSPNTVLRIAVICYHTQLCLSANEISSNNIIKLNKRFGFNRVNRMTVKRSSKFKMIE
ncbi:hypothetical protein BJ875DRAFT_472762 [Amylocarpus encephaloides]|uniref:DUF7708 domain-containing protein n=1 Tax=Amylocarpus encephaloides TaxID=45428 RepID=A0A9P7YAP1_9HELO|nr:hypothetical protein BJ875DRAFT_472762 [Amylocarpus encephaloides]